MPGARRHPRRSGLSRMEVVILLLILVLLTGLLLTGIERVREAAARAKCQNNQKQLGLAFLCYSDTYNGRLPPLIDQGEGTPTGEGLQSAFFSISPFIEAAPQLYRAKDSPAAAYHAPSSVAFTFQHKDGSTGTNYGGVANQLRWVFIDPADDTAKDLLDVKMTLPDGTTGYYAGGSYAVNGLLNWGSGGEPPMHSSSRANTILITERPKVCRTGTGEEIYNLWGLGFYSPHMPAFAALTPTEPPGLWSTGQVAPVRPLPSENAADRDAQIRFKIGRADAEPQLPDFSSPIQLFARGKTCDPRLPGSPHRAGMQSLMCDGSVRLFTFDTEPWIFWSACSPR